MVQVTNYNITEITNSSNAIVGLFQYTSEATNYVPGIMLFFAIYIILFLSLTFRGSRLLATFAVCNFVGFFLALLFFPLGILPGSFLVVMIILLAFSAFLLFL